MALARSINYLREVKIEIWMLGSQLSADMEMPKPLIWARDRLKMGPKAVQMKAKDWGKCQKVKPGRKREVKIKIKELRIEFAFYDL